MSRIFAVLLLSAITHKLVWADDKITQGDVDTVSNGAAEIQTDHGMSDSHSQDPGPLDGSWTTASGIGAFIEGNKVSWRTGRSSTLRMEDPDCDILSIHNGDAIYIMLSGKKYTAQFVDDKLEWDDGDHWTRQGCPSGYLQLGDVGQIVPGLGLSTEGSKAASIESCSERCGGSSRCGAFEWHGGGAGGFCALNQWDVAVESAQTAMWPGSLTCRKTCKDLSGSAVDEGGNGCADYLVESCGTSDDDDFTSDDMCCHCGGGHLAVTENDRAMDEEKAAVKSGEKASSWTWQAILSAVIAGCWCIVAPWGVMCYMVWAAGKRGELLDAEFSLYPSDGLRGDYEGVDADQTAVHTSKEIRGELYIAVLIPFLSALVWAAMCAILRFRGGEVADWLQGLLICPIVYRACVCDAAFLRRITREGARSEEVARTTRRAGETHMEEDYRRREQHARDCTVRSLVLTEASSPLGTPLRVPFLLSKWEVVDAVTDGISIAAVFFMERSSKLFRDRLHAAWGFGPFGRLLAPLVLRLGLSGLMLTVQIAAASVQLAFGLAPWLNGRVGDVFRLDLVGAGAAAVRLEEIIQEEQRHESQRTAADALEEEEERLEMRLAKLVHDRREEVTALRHIGRVAFEGAPQLLLQSSAVLAEGGGLLNSPMLTFSIISTGALMLKKAMEMANPTVNLIWDGIGDNDTFELIELSFAVVVSISVPVCVFMVAARLVASEFCDSNVFDLGHWQCVPAPTL